MGRLPQPLSVFLLVVCALMAVGYIRLAIVKVRRGKLPDGPTYMRGHIAPGYDLFPKECAHDEPHPVAVAKRFRSPARIGPAPSRACGVTPDRARVTHSDLFCAGLPAGSLSCTIGLTLIAFLTDS